MEEKPLINSARNNEVEQAIAGVRLMDLGPQSARGVGQANALATLNVAESLQLLQAEMASNSEDFARTITEAVTKIIDSNQSLAASNGRYARALNWLTGALVFVGVVQVFVEITKHT